LRTPPNRFWGPSSLLYNGYRAFSGGKAAGAWRWTPTHHLAPRFRKEYSYICTPLWAFVTCSTVTFTFTFTFFHINFDPEYADRKFPWRVAKTAQFRTVQRTQNQLKHLTSSRAMLSPYLPEPQ